MLREEVDMISNDHQVANAKIWIHATSRIAHEERIDTKLMHDTLRKCYLFHGVSLIKVEASFHGHDILSTQFAKNQLTVMPLNGRHREVGDVFVRKLIGVSYL